YNVAVSGMTSDGTVVASVNAGGAQDVAGNGNDASTSTDNSVDYDGTAPTVTIDKAVGQADPTNTSPINFTVVFSEAVTGFDNADVLLSGTAGATTAVVTGSGTTYNVEVSGMTVSGTVIASVNAGGAQDGAGNLNVASTSTDNSVDFTYEQPPSIIDTVASSEVSVAGTVSGDYLLTTQDGGGAQSITERVSGGKPNLRYSYLEHKWVFNLPQGNLVTLYAKAWSGGSTDQDQFDFAYSTNDVDYFEMFSVVNTTPEGYVSFILPAGTQGTVYVRVKDSNRTSGNLNLDTIYIDHLYIQSEVIPGSSPDDPTDLNAVAFSAYQIDLTWTDVAIDELGYYIERSVDNNNWFPLDTVGAGSSQFTDLTVVPGTTYYYRVQAYNGSGISSYSNVASAATPSGLTLEGFGYKVKGVNTAELTWTGSSATAFDIYRNGNLLEGGVVGFGTNQNPYIDEVGLKGTYSYQVCEANSQTICSNIVDIDL
ncbi:MAG: Ig-like domain-containing protein, partial [Anaerolineales bacterium]